jgi:hypothetical protein
MATILDPFGGAPRPGLQTGLRTAEPLDPFTMGSSSSLADMAVMGERLVQGSRFELPTVDEPIGATRLYNPTTKEVFVNGFKFNADDEAAALQSEQYLGQRPVPAPPGDWVPLDDTAYRQYLQDIRDPSVARQFSRSFGRAVDYTQMLAGRGLQLAGAEQLGGRIVEQQMEDLRRTQPYAREFTDVEDVGDLGMWLVSVFGELGPNIVENIAAAGVGALAGTAASGNPLGGAAAGLASLVGKQTWKESVKAALKRRATGQAALPGDAKLIRTAAAIGGATAATLASGYATGAADIYGELREQGAGPEDAGARVTALLGGVPYAALDVAPEALLVRRLLGQIGARPTLKSLPTRRAKAGELLKRGAVGAGVGAPAEGFAEAGQEALLLGLSDQELGSADGIKRLTNAFAAGAAAGGVLGAGANVLNPTNLLEPGKGTEPSAATVTLPPTAPRGTQGELFPKALGGPAVSALPDRTAERPRFIAERQQLQTFISSANAELQAMAGGTMPFDQARASALTRQIAQARTALQQVDARLAQLPAAGVTPPQPGQLGLFQPDVTPVAQRLGELRGMPAGPMVQGGLPLVGGEVAPGYVSPTAVPPEAAVGVTPQPGQMSLFEPTVQGELPLAGGQVAPGYVPPSVSPTEVPTVPETGLTAEEAAAQGALQFAPEAPEPPGGGTMANRLREIQDQLRREREFSAAQAQLLAQREAELEALAQQSLNARDIFEMEQRPPLPMVPATPRAPRQLPLFPPGALPGPTRRQRQAAATPLAEIPPGATRLRRQRAQRPQEQLPLPYVATNVTPEIARATWNDRRPPTVRKWEALSEEAQQKWTDAIIAAKATPALRAQISREETQARLTKPKEKPSAVQEQGAATVPAQPGAAVGEGVGAEVPGQAPPTGKGTKLKRGKEAKPRKPLKKEPPPPKPEEAVAPPPPPPPPTKTAEEIEAETTAAREAIAAERANAEAQWNNERLPSDVAFADLPAAAQEEWQKSDRSGAAQVVITQKLLDDGYELNMTITERLNFALAAATAALDGANFAQFTAPTVVDVIVEVAYFTPDNYKKEQIDDALEFLSDPLEFSDAHLEAIADSFVDLAGGQTLETKTKATKAGGEGGADKAWYTYAKNTPGVMQRLANRGVVFRILTDEEARAYVESTVLSRQNLPKKKAKSLFGEEVSAKEDAESDPKNSPLTKLLRLITDINTSTVPYKESLVKQRQRELKTLYAKVLDLDLDTTQVSPLFDAAGNPYTISVNKVMRVVTKAEATKEEATRREAMLKELEAANKATKTDTINSFDDFVRTEGKGKPGRNFVDIDGKPVTKPLDLGRVRMVLANFLSKLVVKPKVYVFRSQADLKATNPRLYERAAAARPEGDFDRTPASGYAFGNNEVIIFTDRLKTEQQLRFVLAHETIGHIGLRSLIPKAQFDKLMLDIYERSPSVQKAVDASMDVRGLPKPEAVEEYLSDFAAALDVSVINRVWNAIKGALNRLGIKFGDEAARYWVNHAREYIRTGRSSMFTVQDVVTKIHALETGQDPDNVGRFAATGNLRNDNLAAGLLYDNVGGMPSSLAEAWETTKGIVGNRQDGWDRFKAQVFSLFNFRARENPGLSALERLLSDARGLSMQIKNALNEKLALVTNLSVADITAGLPGLGGITQDQLAQTNKLLYDAQRYAASRLKKLSDLGRTPLFVINPDGGLTPNQPEIDRLFEQGKITFEQARDGFTYEDRYPGEDGKEVVETVQIPGIPGLTKDSIVWKGYESTREAMRDVELALLRARYLAYTQDRDLAFREIGEVTTTGKLTADESRFFERAYRKYRDLWLADKKFNEDGDLELNADSIDKANEFLVAFNMALLGKGTDRNAAVAAFFEGQQADDMVQGIQAFKDRFIISEDTEFLIQNRIKDILIAEVSSTDADLYTKRTLATGYTPVLRRGGFQVRVMATVGGRVVRLRQDYKEQLVYSQFEAQSDAVEMANTINKDLFGDKSYKVEAYNEATMRFEPMEVKLTAKAETALDAIAAPPDLNLNEFVRGLRQFSITLPPAKLKQVVVALTRQDNRARQRLQRGFVPGADPNAVRAVSEHIEARASTIAKVTMRPALAELMNLNMRDTQALWNGDKDKLDKLKAAWDRVQADPAASVEQKLAAKRAYDEYAFMYRKTNPEGKPDRGNQYYNEAARAVAFLDGNRDVGTSDFEAGRIASQVRAYTSFLQLGGSLATGALNYIGAITNSIPYLATYNDKTAFGGGYGFAKSLAQVSIALNQVGLVKSVRGKFADEDLSTAEFFEQVAKDAALQKRYNLTVDEAKFMAREIREGEMIPALTNSLIATARGRTATGGMQKIIDTWMWTFNATEQAVRRAVGLAAYRMERQRALAARLPAEAAQAKAREAAVAALRFTLGDYAVMNRPPLWQNGIQSFVYMYKVFPTMTIQLLARLPRKGQLAMLGALWILGGVAAFPFAEDLEDIIDTIAQALGLSMGSVRVELAKMIDTIMPGASPYVLRGAANDFFPGNIADRVSVGNFIPGTGIGLAGANVGQELTDIAGPAASMLTGVGQSAIDILRIPGETRTAVDVMRESPITMFRAMGDAIAYSQSGAIVDRRGYVVVPEVGPLLLATRLLGFYPSAASQQYDIIRAAKRMTDYQKEKVAGFRHAWIQAKIQGDEGQARAVVEAVDRWNEGAEGTGLEIRNFLANANRALREARRPAGERFLRATPRAARDDLAVIEDLLGYTD